MGLRSVDIDNTCPGGGIPGGGSSGRLRILEQQLRQLTDKKDKAEKSHDAEGAAKLDQKIQQVRQEIERLKGQERNQEKAAPEEDAQERGTRKVRDSDAGRYVDEQL